jgi:hypothetical protein
VLGPVAGLPYDDVAVQPVEGEPYDAVDEYPAQYVGSSEYHPPLPSESEPEAMLLHAAPLTEPTPTMTATTRRDRHGRSRRGLCPQ